MYRKNDFSSKTMQVTCLFVIALLDTLRSAPQRPASHTSHTFTTASPLVFECAQTHACARALLHTIHTSLHSAPTLHTAQHRLTLHIDAHHPKPASASASYLHNTLGPATRPARAHLGPQQVANTFSTLSAAHLTLQALGTRTHGAAHARNTRHSRSTQPNTPHLANPPPVHTIPPSYHRRFPQQWHHGLGTTTPPLSPPLALHVRDPNTAPTAIGRCAPGALTRAITELPTNYRQDQHHHAPRASPCAPTLSRSLASHRFSSPSSHRIATHCIAPSRSHCIAHTAP